MRYRRFGQSDIEVSEVGFGTWTLASDWWGEVENKQGMLHAALDAGINFIDTAPVYGENGSGETLLADILAADRAGIVITTKCGYDIAAERRNGTQRERPHDWRPESSGRRSRSRSPAWVPTTSTSTNSTTCRIEHIQDDEFWETLGALVAEGKVLALGVALGTGDRMDRRGRRVGPPPSDICSLQTVFNILEQGPGSRSPRAQGRRRSGDPHLACPACVRHAVGQGRAAAQMFPAGDHRAHRNKQNMLDNFEKAETIAFLWEGTGRTRGQAAIAGILANAAFATVLPTCVDVDEVREYAAASDLPLTPTRSPRSPTA